jgi:Holliday junction DNA helicase RuvB
MSSEEPKPAEPGITPGYDQAAPSTFNEFVGQERLKSRLQLAVEAAKERGETVGHILLVGPPGSGKATLARIVGTCLGVRVKCTNGLTIEARGDLAGLLTNLEEGEVLQVEDLHALNRNVAEYLCPPMKDFKMDIIIDQGPNARPVVLNLPRFTLVATATRNDRIPAALLSSFQPSLDSDVRSAHSRAPSRHCGL